MLALRQYAGVQVLLLYFDGCPHWQVAAERLAEALRQAGHTDVIVERRLVTTDAEAQAAHFRGSPTILIDGRDLFAGDDTGSFGLTCRIYPTDDGPAGSPTVDAMVAAIQARA